MRYRAFPLILGALILFVAESRADESVSRSVTITGMDGALLGSIQVFVAPPPDHGDPTWGSNFSTPTIFMPHLQGLPPGMATVTLMDAPSCQSLDSKALNHGELKVGQSGWAEDAFIMPGLMPDHVGGHSLVVSVGEGSPPLACGSIDP